MKNHPLAIPKRKQRQKGPRKPLFLKPFEPKGLVSVEDFNTYYPHLEVTLKRNRHNEVEITWYNTRLHQKDTRYFVMSGIEQEDRFMNKIMNDFYLSTSFPFEHQQIKEKLCLQLPQ